MDLSDFTFTRRAWVDAAPADVHRLVSDVSAISRWSPNATDVAYDDDAGPEAGAWFSGRNRRDGKEWTTRSQVVEAEPGAVFAFVAVQSWRLLRMDPVLGSTRADVIALRDYMAASAETTLVSLAEWVTRNLVRRAPRRG